MRTVEVAQLEEKVEVLQAEVGDIEHSADEVQSRLKHLQGQESLIGLNVDKYDNDPEWHLPEPGPLMSAKTFKAKIVEPFISKLKEVVRSIVAQYLRLEDNVKELKNELSKVRSENSHLLENITDERKENKKLGEVVRDYKCVRKVLGEEQADSILAQAKAEEQALKRPVRSKKYHER